LDPEVVELDEVPELETDCEDDVEPPRLFVLVATATDALVVAGALVPLPPLAASPVAGATDWTTWAALDVAAEVPRTFNGSELVVERIGNGVADESPVSRAKTLPMATARPRQIVEAMRARRRFVSVRLPPDPGLGKAMFSDL
jgi:hypothetical protein